MFCGVVVVVLGVWLLWGLFCGLCFSFWCVRCGVVVVVVVVVVAVV